MHMETGETESANLNDGSMCISTMKCFKLLTMDREYLNISWQQSNCIRILYDNDRRSLRPTNPAFLKQFPILVHENTNVILKVRHKVSITDTSKRMSTTGIQYCFVVGKKEIVGCLNTSAPFSILFLVQHLLVMRKLHSSFLSL